MRIKCRKLTEPGSSRIGESGKIYDLNGYKIEVSSTTSIESIKNHWKILENNNTVPFFLTWNWISTWIKTYSPKLITVSASFNNHIVAIGLFTESKEVRHNIIWSNQLRLHQTGNQAMDQIWIEYNDFICEKEHQLTAVNTCLEVLNSSDFRWDEIVISMMPEKRATKVADALRVHISDNITPGYIANLDNVRRQKLTYLQSLSANTRYQVRKSIKIYEGKFGPLKLIAASNKEEALSHFHDCAGYHIKKWNDSGYKNPYFTQFHQNLIHSSFDNGSVELSRLIAGNETIAILYHHLVGKQVYFYLHGLNYHPQKNLKPGLVAHVFATESYLQKGMNTYDFMGGYSQYKAQLADHEMDFISLVIQRPRSRFKLENMARKIKRHIMSSTK